MGFFSNTEALEQGSGGGGYLNPGKLGDGDSVKFRILSHPIEGWSYWNADKKPVRLRKAPPALPPDIQYRDGKADAVKFFAAFAVWNYREGSVQVCELTQKGILKAIQTYGDHEDYGDPLTYDLTLTRKGKGLETEYTLIASPPKPFPFEEQAIDSLASLNLEAIFNGGNPFGGGGAMVPAGNATPEHIQRVKATREALGFSQDWVRQVLANTPGFPANPMDLTPDQAAVLISHMQTTAAQANG